MALVQYNGPNDVREVGVADLKRLGVEGAKKLVAPKGEAVEVSSQVLDVLLTHDAFDGEFTELKDVDQEQGGEVEPLTEKDLVGPDVQSGTSNDGDSVRGDNKGSTHDT